jgi:hypothetical protein
MSRDCYTEMRKEFLSLWEILRKKSDRITDINQRIIRMTSLAVDLDGKTRKDTERFFQTIDPFLLGKLKPEKIYKYALKLEQDTREL